MKLKITAFITALIVVFGSVLLVQGADYAYQLGTFEERAQLAVECGLVDNQSAYYGTAKQNLELLKCGTFGSGGEELEPTSIGTGATSADPNVTYVTDVTDDFAVGGTDSSAPLYFDTSAGDLDVDGNLVVGGNTNLSGTLTVPTSTIANLNGTIVVDGNTYAQTGQGLKNAINANCNGTTPCTIKVPAGDYTGTAITLPSLITLAGDGIGKTNITLGSDTATGVFVNSDLTNGNASITIRDLSVNGDKANRATGIGILLRKCKGCLIENVEVYDTPNAGIQMDNSTDGFDNILRNVIVHGTELATADGIVINSNLRTRLENVTSYNNARDGIRVTGTGGVTMNTQLSNIYTYSNTAMGLRIGDGTNYIIGTSVVNIHSYLNGDSGITIEKSDRNSILNGYSYNNTTNGLLFDFGSSFNTVTGGMYASNTQVGLYIFGTNESTNGNSISNVNAVGNGRHGIAVKDGSKNSITGGVQKNNSQEGAGLYNGIDISVNTGASNRNSIKGVTAFDDQGTQTQDYGIAVDTNSIGTILNSNNVEGNRTGGIENLSNSPEIFFNDTGILFTSTTTMNATTTFEKGLDVNIDSGEDAYGIDLVNGATNYGFRLNQSGNLSAGKSGLEIYSNTALNQSAAQLVKIHVDNSSAARQALVIVNDGTNYTIQGDCNGSNCVFWDHDDTGVNPTVSLDRDGNNASDITGMLINVANAGAGGVIGLHVQTGKTILQEATTTQLVVGSPTGGGQGAGTINAVAVYDDSVILTGADYVFDDPEYEHLTVKQVSEFVKNNFHLPWVQGREEAKANRLPIGEKINQVLEAVENVWLYVEQLFANDSKQDEEIEQLNKRIEKLEALLGEGQSLCLPN